MVLHGIDEHQMERSNRKVLKRDRKKNYNKTNERIMTYAGYVTRKHWNQCTENILALLACSLRPLWEGKPSQRERR